MEFEDVLELALDHRASDVHFHVGTAPWLRINGELRGVDAEPLDAGELDALIKGIAPRRERARLRQRGSADFAFSYDGDTRIRVSIFKRGEGNRGMVMRLIPDEFYSLNQLGLPRSVRDLCCRSRGLVLITGPAGSGKSTTLASFLDHINRSFAKHILTIEDPIEFTHEHRSSVVTQRSLGVDVPTFEEGIRSGVRMDPDVLMVGEMRDRETIAAALTAAETGHLVFATLHTNSASQTIHRILDLFPGPDEKRVRHQLSMVLAGILSQVLLPRRVETGRVAAFEILLATPGIRNMIRQGREQNIPTALQTGGQLGMRTLDQSLARLSDHGTIAPDVARVHARDPENFETVRRSDRPDESADD